MSFETQIPPLLKYDGEKMAVDEDETLVGRPKTNILTRLATRLRSTTNTAKGPEWISMP